MNRKKILEKRMARLKAKQEELRSRGLQTTDEKEAADIKEKLSDLTDQIADIQDELDVIAEEESEKAQETEGTETRSAAGQPQRVPATVEVRGGSPLASYSLGGGPQESRDQTTSSRYASMEYRTAFMNYVQHGVPIPASLNARAAGEPGITLADEIEAIIPETIMKEFIKETTKVYGHIYAKVRKLNIRGGLKFPISNLKANFKWINETTVSDTQNAGDIRDYIQFDYNIAEIRVAQSLLSEVVSLDLFEAEITRIMIEAYVEAMDKAIINGTGNNQILGITNDPRITNIVEFTDKEMGDWTKWRTKLFAAIPLAKRGKGEFLFPASTVEAYLMTMKDNNNRPVFKEATDLTIGNTGGSFFGKNVDLVEPDIIADYATAAEGDVIGVFWVPDDYVINTNYQFGIKRWEDHDHNMIVNRGLTIVDGKIVDASGCYLLKKKASSAA